MYKNGLNIAKTKLACHYCGKIIKKGEKFYFWDVIKHRKQSCYACEHRNDDEHKEFVAQFNKILKNIKFVKGIL